MPVPKEQPPRKLSGNKDRSDLRQLWRVPGQDRGAEGIAISGKLTEGAPWAAFDYACLNGAGMII